MERSPTTLRLVHYALVLGFTLAALAGADKARAQTHIDSVRFDVHLDLGWYQEFGAGFRADIPIVKNGFLHRYDDDLAITFGGDLVFDAFNHDHFYGHYYGGYDNYWAIISVVAAQWNIYFTSEWSVMAEAGLALAFVHADFPGPGGSDTFWYWRPYIGAGGRYHFSQRNALLLRLSFPTGLQIGITF